MTRRKHDTSETGLSDAFRINVRGRPETEDALAQLRNLANQTDARDTWGRRVGNAPILNGLALYVARLPREQQVPILETSIRMLAQAIALAEGEDPATYRPGAPPTSRAPRRAAPPRSAGPAIDEEREIPARGEGAPKPPPSGRKQPKPPRKFRRRLG